MNRYERTSGFSEATLPAPTITQADRKYGLPMVAIFVLVFVTAFAIFAVLRIGEGYYLAAPSERPPHALHETLKPSGLIGQGFGVVGGLFCILTLLYPLRKRWHLLENVGTLRNWFVFHVYFGIAGPLLATLHTTFKFGGLASICYWSMMLVMVSGFIGRFLFALLPRNQHGLVLSLHEIDEEIHSIKQVLETAGLHDGEIASGGAIRGVSKINGKARAGWHYLFYMWATRRRNSRIWNQQLRVRGFNPSSARHMMKLLSRKLFLEGSVVTLNLTTRAFSQWHILHLPLTYLFFATLAIHTALAIFLGYRWIF